MNKSAIALAFSLLIGPALTPTAISADCFAGDHGRGCSRYRGRRLRLFVSAGDVDITRKQSTNIEVGKESAKGR